MHERNINGVLCDLGRALPAKVDGLALHEKRWKDSRRPVLGDWARSFCLAPRDEGPMGPLALEVIECQP